jgi:hypothetical protein
VDSALIDEAVGQLDSDQEGVPGGHGPAGGQTRPGGRGRGHDGLGRGGLLGAGRRCAGRGQP